MGTKAGAPPEEIHHPMNRLMREARDMVLNRGIREIDQNTLTALAADLMDQRLCRMEQKQHVIMERLGGGIHVRFSKRSLTVTAGTMASIAGVALGLVKSLGG